MISFPFYILVFLNCIPFAGYFCFPSIKWVSKFIDGSNYYVSFKVRVTNKTIAIDNPK